MPVLKVFDGWLVLVVCGSSVRRTRRTVEWYVNTLQTWSSSSMEWEETWAN